jgi:transcriptional regulator with XRE-family HTH domain
MSTLPPPMFASLLRRARRAAGLTQEELAERAGISVDAISALERGLSRAPHQDTLELLAEVLQLSAEERAEWDLAMRGKRLPDAPSPAGPGDDQLPPASRTPRLSPRRRSWGANRRSLRSVPCCSSPGCVCSR